MLRTEIRNLVNIIFMAIGDENYPIAFTKEVIAKTYQDC